MRKLATKAILAALLSLDFARAAAGEYSYIANGADWPLMSNTECMKTNQSPIDLRTSANSAPFTTATATEASFSYANFGAAKATNLGKTIQIDIPKDDQENNFFTTQHVPDVRKGTDKFTAAQFHFHAKSEHTIDGKRYDMEMHIVHVASEGKGDPTPILYSALGFMFDVDDYDQSITPGEMKTVNEFFDSLKFENIPPTGKAEKHVLNDNATVPLANLVGLQSGAGRWVYTGSLTTPPCTVGVFFQVYDRVLPISRKHLNMYLAQQREYSQDVVYTKDGKQTASSKVSLDKTGNWRVTNKVDNHDVYYLKANHPAQLKQDYDDSAMTMGILFAVFMVLIIIMIGVTLTLRKKIDAKASNMMLEGGAKVELGVLNSASRLNQVNQL